MKDKDRYFKQLNNKQQHNLKVNNSQAEATHPGIAEALHKLQIIALLLIVVSAFIV